MQIQSAKKISQFTDDELVQLASNSEADATKVAQEAWNASIGRANSLYRRLSELNTVTRNTEARRLILRFIERVGLGGPNVDTLLNLLQSDPIESEYQFLRAIAVRYRESIAPALMLVSKGTPDQVIDDISVETGLSGLVDANKSKIRKTTIDMLKQVFDAGVKWENERGAIFLSKIVAQESLGDFKEMIKNMRDVPIRFLCFIGREGSQSQRAALNSSHSPEIISKLIELQFTGEWPLDPGRDKNQLFLDWMRSDLVSIDKKLEKFDEVYGRADTNTRNELVKTVAKLPNIKAFSKILRMFENGETDEIEAITSNLQFSVSSFSRIISAMNKRGIPMDKADPFFLNFVQKIRGKIAR